MAKYTMADLGLDHALSQPVESFSDTIVARNSLQSKIKGVATENQTNYSMLCQATIAPLLCNHQAFGLCSFTPSMCLAIKLIISCIAQVLC
jgi:hypothetical protein